MLFVSGWQKFPDEFNVGCNGLSLQDFLQKLDFLLWKGFSIVFIKVLSEFFIRVWERLVFHKRMLGRMTPRGMLLE
jgi:hypothetical protein